MKSLSSLAFLALALLAPASLADDRAFLGVGVDPAKGGKGLLVRELTDGSAAEKAGLKEGDLLLKFDGKKPKDFEALVAAVRAHKPGDKVELVYRRGGEEKTVEVELGAAPEEASEEANEPPEEANESGEEKDEAPEAAVEKGAAQAKGAWLGVLLEADDEGNKSIAQVVAGSPAARVGLKKGDRILLFNGKPGSDIEQTIAGSKPGDKVEIKVKRGDAEKEFVVVLGKKEAQALVVPGRQLRLAPLAPNQPFPAEPPQLSIPRARLFRAEPEEDTTRQVLEEIRALRKEVGELRKQIEKLSARER